MLVDALRTGPPHTETHKEPGPPPQQTQTHVGMGPLVFRFQKLLTWDCGVRGFRGFDCEKMSNPLGFFKHSFREVREFALSKLEPPFGNHRLSGKEKHKHKQICGIVPDWVGAKTCLCFFFFFVFSGSFLMGENKYINKIPPNSGQPHENFVYVFYLHVFFFRSLPPQQTQTHVGMDPLVFRILLGFAFVFSFVAGFQFFTCFCGLIKSGFQFFGCFVVCFQSSCRSTVIDCESWFSIPWFQPLPPPFQDTVCHAIC